MRGTSAWASMPSLLVEWLGLAIGRGTGAATARGRSKQTRREANQAVLAAAQVKAGHGSVV